MDKAHGGAFFSCLLSEYKDGVMPSHAVRKVMKDILNAVGHCHLAGILHRDIKPDNLVMQIRDDVESPSGKVRKVALIDFDHAEPDWNQRSPGMHHVQDAWCGTVRFSAPETFNGLFSPASDLYSVGVILYMLMTGNMPYGDDVYEYGHEVQRAAAESPKCASPKRCNWHPIYNSMREVQIDWQCNPWPEQPECRDFCERLLSFESRDRPQSCEEALKHPWFREN